MDSINNNGKGTENLRTNGPTKKSLVPNNPVTSQAFEASLSNPVVQAQLTDAHTEFLAGIGRVIADHGIEEKPCSHPKGLRNLARAVLVGGGSPNVFEALAARTVDPDLKAVYESFN